jgi:hypothetical protein
MRFQPFLFAALMGLLISCQTPESPSQEGEKPALAEPKSSLAPPTESPAETVAQPPVCRYQDQEFKRQWGQGILLFHTHGEDSLALYRDTTAKPDHILSGLWANPPKHFKAFRWPNTYEAGVLVLLDSSASPAWLRVSAGGDFWIRRVDLSGLRFSCQTSWPAYWQTRSLFLPDSTGREDRLRESPSEKASSLPLPGADRLYKVLAAQWPWLQIAEIVPQGIKQSDSISPPLGWLKAYCEDAWQIHIAGQYEIEDFYARREFSAQTE